jgi:hypothetical protein
VTISSSSAGRRDKPEGRETRSGWYLLNLARMAMAAIGLALALTTVGLVFDSPRGASNLAFTPALLIFGGLLWLPGVLVYLWVWRRICAATPAAGRMVLRVPLAVLLIGGAVVLLFVLSRLPDPPDRFWPEGDMLGTLADLGWLSVPVPLLIGIVALPPALVRKRVTVPE